MYLIHTYDILKSRYKSSILLKDLELIINSYNESMIDIKEENVEKLVKNYSSYNEQKVSCAILTKNEERKIERCISGVIGNFDEVIVVDAGSNDNTLSLINKKYPQVKTYIEPWQGDFSLQRNKAIQYTSNDWIFFIDADNYMEPTEDNIIKRIAKVVSYLDISGVISPHIIEHDQSISIDTRKMFRKSDKVKFFGKVHEEPLYITKKTPSNIVANINIYHDGYDPKKTNLTEKTYRNLDLVKQMIKEDSRNPKWYYFYARALYILNQDREIIRSYLLQGLKLSEQWTDKRYYANIVSHLCRLSYETHNFKDLKLYNSLLSECTHNCSDVDYYNTVILLFSLLNKMDNLRDILGSSIQKYKCENYHSFINQTHEHISGLLIQMELTLGRYDNALYLLDNLKNEEIKGEFITKIYDINERTSNYINSMNKNMFIRS